MSWGSHRNGSFVPPSSNNHPPPPLLAPNQTQHSNQWLPQQGDQEYNSFSTQSIPLYPPAEQQQLRQQHQTLPPASAASITAASNMFVADSFNTDDTWNWSVGEEPNATASVEQSQHKQPDADDNDYAKLTTQLFPKIGDLSKRPQTIRGKLETPQWSTESQPSLESSDDIIRTSSDSDKSRMLSRSSTTTTISHSPPIGYKSLISAPLENPPPPPPPATASSYNIENRELLNVENRNSPSSYFLPPRSTQTPPTSMQTSLQQDVYKRPPSGYPFKPTPAKPASFQFNNQSANLETWPDNSEHPDYAPASSAAASGGRQQRNHWSSENNETAAPINDRNQYLETGQLSEISRDSHDLKWESGNDMPLPPPGLQRMIPGSQNDSVSVGGGASGNMGSSLVGNDPPPGLSRMVLGQNESSSNISRQSYGGDDLISGVGGGPPEGLHRMIPGESSSPETSLMPQHQHHHTYNRQPSPIDMPLIEFSHRSTSNGPRSATIGGSDTPSPPPQSSINQQSNASNVRLELASGSVADGSGAAITGGSADFLSTDNPESEHVSKRKISADPPDNYRREMIEGHNNDLNVAVMNLSSSVRSLTVGDHHDDDNDTDRQISNIPSSANSQQQPQQSSRRHSRQEESSGDNNSDRKRQTGRQASHREKRSAERQLKPRDRGERNRERDNEKENQRYKDYHRYSPDVSTQDRRRGGRRGHRDRRYEEDTDYYSDREKERRMHEDKEREYDRKYSSLRKEKDRHRDSRKEREYQRMMDRDHYRESRHRRGGRDDYYTSGGGGAGGNGRYWNGTESVDNNRSSRPSSRSDSMHESSSYGYRGERHHDGEKRERRIKRDKEKEYRNRSEQSRGAAGSDIFNPYQNYSYDPYNPYYQQYQYYENLRRTNPQAYAEWYRKYYQQSQHGAGSVAASFAGDERASVHSGRSSANDELLKDRYTRQSFYNQSSFTNYYGHTHSSLLSGLDNNNSSTYDQKPKSYSFDSFATQQQQQPQRLTPNKFTCAHMKTIFINGGRLLRVLPNYPTDGDGAIVELQKFQELLRNNGQTDADFNELNRFPGPLIKGVTHKKQILEYCDNKIKGALTNSNNNKSDDDNNDDDAESYILMWEFLMLLIRQNGVVVGTDIAELLLKSAKKSTATTSSPSPSVYSNNSNSASGEKTETPGDNANGAQVVPSEADTQSQLTESEITLKFREYLLYGSCKEALEWAMKHGLWGHALFLASKLDKRTYGSVMMRFANGLAINDPLQTLYQLLSGKMPAVVTCASDEKWGDWRPHLAMIVSNSTHQRTAELNRKAITQLGDTLYNRGSNYAAQFCYLIAEVEFGKHEDQQTKMVLLGADHRKPYPYFATNEAIHMTEIYEYACSLNDQQFAIDEFQFYKYMLAARLADYGFPERALLYLEKLSDYIIRHPTKLSNNVIDGVCQLADRLKFYDPVNDDEEDDADVNINSSETNRPDKSWLKALKNVQNASAANTPDEQQNGQQQSITQVNWPQQQPSEYPSPILKPSIVPYQHQLQDPQNSIIAQNQYERTELDGQFQQLQQQPQKNDNGQSVSYGWTGFENQSWTDQSNQNKQQVQQPSQLLPDQRQTHQINNYNKYENLNINQPEPELNKDTLDDPLTAPPQMFAYDYHQQSQDDKTIATSQQKPYEMNRINENEQLGPINIHNSQQSQSINNNDSNNGQNKADIKKTTTAPNSGNGTTTSSGGGWLGGIFNKLTMKPKNQMILPDDKNPKIVWDQDKKRWINVDEDPNDPVNEFKPPPKMSEMLPESSNMTSNFYSTPNNNNPDETLAPPGAGPVGGSALNVPTQIPNSQQANMFKLPKGGRNLKNSYVNVFKQNGATTTTPPTNFLIPQPVSNANAPIDFITPGGSPRLQSLEQQKQLQQNQQ